MGEAGFCVSLDTHTELSFSIPQHSGSFFGNPVGELMEWSYEGHGSGVTQT
jgi:hypothetical protein